MLSLTALALVVITHNILTHADHRPDTVLAIIDDDLLMDATPDILNEVARLNEDQILNQIIPPEEKSGDAVC